MKDHLMIALESNSKQQITLRGHHISEDVNGLVSLDDIWAAANAKDTQRPKHWRNTRGAKALEAELQKKVSESYRKLKTPALPIVYASKGRGSAGTFAHPVLAAAYAGYLSPALEIEVREVWLRYRAGDATLADEILQKATAEANRWAGTRALSRAQRNTYTDRLKEHGVAAKGYMECTEALYLHLLGGRSYQLRDKMGLPARSNLRDAFSTDQLSYVMATEALTAERIEDEERYGNQQCVEATAICASAIRRAIEADRKDRQKRMF